METKVFLFDGILGPLIEYNADTTHKVTPHEFLVFEDKDNPLDDAIIICVSTGKFSHKRILEKMKDEDLIDPNAWPIGAGDSTFFRMFFSWSSAGLPNNVNTPKKYRAKIKKIISSM